MTTEELIALQAKMTKGPWAIEQPNEQTPHLWITAKSNGSIAKLEVCDYDDGLGARLTSEDQVNARAIAQTPELIAEVIRLRQALGRWNAAYETGRNDPLQLAYEVNKELETRHD